MDLAASIERLNESTELISGFEAPLLTKAPIPTLAISVRLPVTTLPWRSSKSICSPEMIATSAASPFSRRSVIAPIAPSKSDTTLCPDDCSNLVISSSITGVTADPESTLISAAFVLSQSRSGTNQPIKALITLRKSCGPMPSSEVFGSCGRRQGDTEQYWWERLTDG